MTDPRIDLEAFQRRHDVHIAYRDGFWLTGLVSTGPFSDANTRISALWEELVNKYGEDAQPDEWLSLCHGRETEFTCYLGVASASRPGIVPDGLMLCEVKPHEYAVASVSGTQEDVNAVYLQLPTWIEAQGREWNDAILWIEAYPEPYRDGQTELDFKVWLPLV